MQSDIVRNITGMKDSAKQSLINSFTSFKPILTTVSSTSLRGTFILSRYEIQSMDDIGVTTKSSVTIIDNGPLVYPPETGDFGSINSNG
jgi:hypothetical protein